jgi:hypothetical protein
MEVECGPWAIVRQVKLARLPDLQNPPVVTTSACKTGWGDLPPYNGLWVEYHFIDVWEVRWARTCWEWVNGRLCSSQQFSPTTPFHSPITVSVCKSKRGLPPPGTPLPRKLGPACQEMIQQMLNLRPDGVCESLIPLCCNELMAPIGTPGNPKAPGPPLPVDPIWAKRVLDLRKQLPKIDANC